MSFRGEIAARALAAVLTGYAAVNTLQHPQPVHASYDTPPSAAAGFSEPPYPTIRKEQKTNEEIIKDQAAAFGIFPHIIEQQNYNYLAFEPIEVYPTSVAARDEIVANRLQRTRSYLVLSKINLLRDYTVSLDTYTRYDHLIVDTRSAVYSTDGKRRLPSTVIPTVIDKKLSYQMYLDPSFVVNASLVELTCELVYGAARTERLMNFEQQLRRDYPTRPDEDLYIAMTYGFMFGEADIKIQPYAYAMRATTYIAMVGAGIQGKPDSDLEKDAVKLISLGMNAQHPDWIEYVSQRELGLQ